MPTILGANTLATKGYQVQNSMMLETGDSSRLSKTFSSASNSNTTFTVSGWFKKTKNGATILFPEDLRNTPFKMFL